jgi:SAM-dependent methyltransferase
MTWVDDVFAVPLVPVAGHLNVLTPEPEASLPKFGVSAAFLAQAEDYFVKFQNYGYLYYLMTSTFERIGYKPKGLVVDFGSGFGNSVIPLLENFDVRVVATDISPDLLKILSRESASRGFQDRCAVVAQDAQNCYFVPQKADLVIGCAVLHHMVRPMDLVKAAITVLKPGGKAVFFEPFELGHQVLRIAYTQILQEAKRRKLKSPAFDFLAGLNLDIQVRSFREKLPSHRAAWKNLDDKWMFCAEHFNKIGKELGCDVEVVPLHGNDKQFTAQAVTALQTYGGMKCPQALPGWAWDILTEFDENYFSPEALRDLPLEACVVITAPEAKAH